LFEGFTLIPGATQQMNSVTKITLDMTVSFTNKVNGLQSPILGIMTDFSSKYSTKNNEACTISEYM
jgi:hypothetical protein